MKAAIHPKYQEDVVVTCSCGNKFTTGSTKSIIAVEVCYKCHPFYTGEQRLMDTKGRVETFQKKMQAANSYKELKKAKKAGKKVRDENEPKSLRELLGGV